MVRYELDKVCIQKHGLVPSGHLRQMGMHATAAV